METRIYPTRDLDVQQIAQALVNEYQAQGFETQQFGDSNQVTVQFRKENTLRTITGFNKALGISFQRSGGCNGGVEPQPCLANRTPSLGHHRVPGLRPGHESVSRRHQDRQRGRLSWLSSLAEV
jgi:hypothetical protein